MSTESPRMSDHQISRLLRDAEDGCYDYSYGGGEAVKQLAAEALRARAVEDKVKALIPKGLDKVLDWDGDGLLRERSPADQLEYLSARLAAILDPEQLPEQTLILIAGIVIRLGVLAPQERQQATDLERARKANLNLHYEINRVRREVGGARTTRHEWRIKIPGRAAMHFGGDEDRARAWIGHRQLMGADEATLQDRLTFLGDWRDVPPKAEVASDQEPAAQRRCPPEDDAGSDPAPAHTPE